jgi:hypothetical protein
MYLQSIKSVKHNATKSVYRSILKKSRHYGFSVFIVNSSMLRPLMGSLMGIYMFTLFRTLCPWDPNVRELKLRRKYTCGRTDLNCDIQEEVNFCNNVLLSQKLTPNKMGKSKRDKMFRDGLYIMYMPLYPYHVEVFYCPSM